MSWYRALVYPALALMDPEGVHERTLAWLVRAQENRVGRAVLERIAGEIPERPVEVFGLRFPNVLGVAAGFDKDVRVAKGLGMLGFGHVEVGTLTPRPQVGNPRPRVFRLVEDGAIINRMGFPNGGVGSAVSRLRTLHNSERDFVLGVSLGKQKETLLADAVEDYLMVMEAVYPYCDYLAVNVSSPNTPGLRDLQGGRYLGHLLRVLVTVGQRQAKEVGVGVRPLLLKIAPDLSWPEIDEILAAAIEAGVDGIIATNTTVSRQGLVGKGRNEKGGLSGRPLRGRSNEVIRYIVRQAGDKLPVIGVGGVFSSADVRAKLDAGAVLVQVYTGLVYVGRGMGGRVLREM
jgi:dihydroorotate dehydrogenase